MNKVRTEGKLEATEAKTATFAKNEKTPSRARVLLSSLRSSVFPSVPYLSHPISLKIIIKIVYYQISVIFDFVYSL